MKPNPIDEVWRIKDRLAAEAGYDVDRFFDQLKAWCAAHPTPGRLIRSPEELRRVVAEMERPKKEPHMALKEEPPRGKK